MRFNPKANIGGGRVSGSSGGGGLGGSAGGNLGGALGGGRLPIPGGMGLKGTILLIIIYFLIQMCSNGALPGSGLPAVPGGSDSSASSTDNGDYDACKTGEDANKSDSCARKAVALSLENFWTKTFEGQNFKPASIVTFNGSINTACGAANAGMGPFYCPVDQKIYEDTSFYEEIFQRQLGGNDAPFVEPYVLGHEYGHHIQNVTGQMKNVRTQQGDGSDAVKLELQADCYAGMWAKAATGTTDASGVPIFESITDEDIQAAITAAQAVGDDSIQEKTQGRVNPDAWTHGSSAQRMKWFKTGYQGGTLESCNIWG